MGNTLYRTGDLSTAPKFYLPAPAGVYVTAQTYNGHSPDDKKMDIYFKDWPHDSAVVAAAAGYVHEHFEPGGVEINHGHGWFTTYMHMDRRVNVGTRVQRGQWVGRADSVGTWAKHLHHEHLYRAGASNANTVDMVNPLIVEFGSKPIVFVVGHPHSATSQNGGTTGGAPGTQTRRQWPSYMPSGHYFGLITGPKESHGGFYTKEQPDIKAIQSRLTALKHPVSADGKYGPKTKAAVSAWQKAKYAKYTTRFGEVWHDDWNRLFTY
jgi:hypothetical protein